MDLDRLRYVFNHVFLPPHLPQSDDSSPLLDKFLTTLLLEALQDAAAKAPEDAPWAGLSCMLKVLIAESSNGDISTVKLEPALRDMKEKGEFRLSLQLYHTALFYATEATKIQTSSMSTRGRGIF